MTNQLLLLPMAAIIRRTALCGGCCFVFHLSDPAAALRSLHADTRGSSRASGPEPGRQNTVEKGSRDECVRTAGETDEDALGAPGDKGALVSG